MYKNHRNRFEQGDYIRFIIFMKIVVYMKNAISIFCLILLLVACTKKTESSTHAPQSKEMKHFTLKQYPFESYELLNGQVKNLVQVISRRDSLSNALQKMYAIRLPSKKEKDNTEKFINKLDSLIDFEKSNLILVSANLGGPPFPKLEYKIEKKNIIFCKKVDTTEISGLALKSIVQIYEAPKDKDIRATWCER